MAGILLRDKLKHTPMLSSKHFHRLKDNLPEKHPYKGWPQDVFCRDPIFIILLKPNFCTFTLSTLGYCMFVGLPWPKLIDLR